MDKASALEIWCRFCKHYDLDGTGDCLGACAVDLARDKPNCIYWGIKDFKYEINYYGKPNW